MSELQFEERTPEGQSLETTAIPETVVEDSSSKETVEESAQETQEEVAQDAEKSGTESKEEQEPEKESSVIRHMRKEIKTLQKRLAELRKEPTPEPVVINRDDFENESDYIDAVVNVKVNEKIGQAQKDKQIEEQTNQKLSKVRETYPDFDDALENVSHVMFTAQHQDALKQAIGTLQYGDELMYHLAKHPDIEEMTLLSPIAFAARLGEIHVEIKALKNKKPSVTQHSKAPAPIKPVTTTTKPDKTYDDMSDDEFFATRRKETMKHKLKFA